MTLECNPAARCTKDFASSFLLPAVYAGRIAPSAEGDISILLDVVVAHWSREREVETYQHEQDCAVLRHKGAEVVISVKKGAEDYDSMHIYAVQHLLPSWQMPIVWGLRPGSNFDGLPLQ